MGWVMRQSSVKQLYAYWDRVRNGRLAPQRHEIEPSAIAPILSETFIAECVGPSRYRFRLAGTRICDFFGFELSGSDLLDYWSGEDKDNVTALLSNVFGSGAVGYALFDAYTAKARSCRFELLMMPLRQGGEAINRALGAISAVERHFWLGTEPMLRQELIELQIHWPDGVSATTGPAALAPSPGTAGPDGAPSHRAFTVYQGGVD